jgi:hypothetical protein
MQVSRHLMATAIVLASGCSELEKPAPFEFPATITFDRQPLGKATSWTRGHIAGAVFVAPGEQLPNAFTQVGAIVSSEHLTSTALQKWMRDQSIRAGEPLFHESGNENESCKVGGDPHRIFVAIGFCKTGDQRAACVEVDETLDSQTFTSCMGGGRYGCFEDVCSAQWRNWESSMELLADGVLKMPKP